MKKMGKKISPLVIKGLVSELRPTHEKKGRGSTIPTKEAIPTPSQKE
jgi:hypothetical protein